MKDKNIVLLKRISIIAVLTAAAYAGTFIQIKLPTGDMIHLGNFVMILAALLLGGIEGGLVGSLGMGLYDIQFYLNKPTTVIRTFLLKFLVGFLVGYLFRLVIKKKIKTDHLLIASTVFFLLLFGVSLGFFIVGDKTDLSFKTGLIAYVSNFFFTGKKVGISLYIPIFSILFASGMILALVFERKLSTRSKAALFAITIAILVNILGEFLLRWALEGFKSTVLDKIPDGFAISLATATSKIPGSLITGFISVILATLIYEPIYRGVKDLDSFKDDTLILEEEQELEKEDKADIQVNEIEEKKAF